MAFRKARNRSEEGAELYLDPEGRRRGIVAVVPERFTDPPALARLLHHELAHLADMVDEAFAYSSDLSPTGLGPSQLRLVRERYRLFWAIRIDGRLSARGLPTASDERQRRAEFDRAFAFLAESQRAEIFNGLWSGCLARHADLLKIAADPRTLRGRTAPVPGATCSLCGFPAFDWIQGEALRSDARARIEAEFPGYHAGDPVCARCAEIYHTITGMEYPATVCL